VEMHVAMAFPCRGTVDEVEREGREDHEPEQEERDFRHSSAPRSRARSRRPRTVGRRLERLVDLFPLEDRDGVLLVLEEPGDRVAADPVRLVLEGVHLTQCS